jgi:UDP-glucose 4-epimerase
MRTYFITGGDGFVGFHLTQELMKDKESKVVIYDAHKHFLPVDESRWFKYQNFRINELGKFGKRVVRIKGDVVDSGRLQEALEEHSPQVVVHLASLPIAGVSNFYPTESRANIFDTICTLLDRTKKPKFPLEKLVYTSSSMVYGDFTRYSNGEVIPAREDQPCNPKGIYGAMKLAGEHLVRAYTERFGIPHTIIRPSAIYGPTDCNMRVSEIFLTNALEGKKLELDNGGLHQLDFSYVKDVAKGFALALNSEHASNETFNLTRGEGRSIRELAEVVKSLIPSTKIVTREFDPYRPNRGALDISKAKNLLGYEPEYSLEEGMKEYHEFVSTFDSKK